MRTTGGLMGYQQSDHTIMGLITKLVQENEATNQIRLEKQGSDWLPWAMYFFSVFVNKAQ